MTRPLLTWIGLSLVLVASLGCDLLQFPLTGSGVSKTETTEVAAFDKLIVTGGATVQWERGEQSSVTVTTDENLMPHLVRRSEGGRLHVHFDRNVRTLTPFVVVVTTPKLVEVGLVGGALMSIQQVDQESLRIEMVGGGGFDAEGRCEKLDVSIVGSGSVKSTYLVTQDVEVQITGSGSAQVYADRSCSIEIVGSGDVFHLGAAEPQIEVIGSGNVRRLNRPNEATDQPREADENSEPSESESTSEAQAPETSESSETPSSDETVPSKTSDE